MTIAELAAATDLSKGFLSQVERDQANVSVASLLRICDALDLSVGSLFDKPVTSFVPRTARTPFEAGGQGVEEFLLSPSSERRIQVIEQFAHPGGGGGDEQWSMHADAEFVHVLRGKLEVRVRNETIVLAAGDSLTFSARDPHTWRNPLPRQVAHSIWIFSPALS